MPDHSLVARIRTTAKTVSALALLQAALPLNAAVTTAALLSSSLTRTTRREAARPKTVLISGGKMTKALQLARCFHAAGHRVILVETAKYRLTGHRFSRAVDRFHVVPDPTAADYTEALVEIVRAEGVDVYVPVCSPTASYYDALAKAALAEHCEVIHGDADVIGMLDDKYEFSVAVASAGLPVLDHHRLSDPDQMADLDLAEQRRPYILKSIPYDPVHRLDLTPLPRATAQQTIEFARTKPITETTPWILQEFVEGQEYCTHSTVRDGVVQLHCCCESSAFQLNYEMVDKPAIAAWVAEFVATLGITGQVSFDFIETNDGELYAIECNPRTHSAITMFYNHPDVAAAYLGDAIDECPVLPRPDSRPTYWLYHEAWRVLTDPRTARKRVNTILRGKDAIFAWSDPLPFLMVHHLHVPSLLVRNLVHGKDWNRVDFNIGKLVEPAGD